MSVLACALVLTPHCQAAAANSLAIVDAGIEQAEDAPYVTTDYQFLPGEYVYAEFHVAGYAVKLNEETDVRAMHIAYKLVPVDAHDVPLAEPVSGEVNERLGKEDKNWLPVKRASFLMPSFVTGGVYAVRISVHDVLSNADTTRSLPFAMGGPRFEPSNEVSVQHFDFWRSPNRRERLDTPAYSPGDTIYTTFDLCHFSLKPDHAYELAYGVSVLRPDGKPFLQEPNAAELRDRTFYPAQYLPAAFDITTKRDSPKGEYLVLVTAHDRVSGASITTRRTFSLE